MSGVYFRAGVGILVVNGDANVLVFRRKKARDSAWQMPQGGIEEGETTLQAALRELREEAGLEASDVEILAEHPDWLVYELPAELRSAKVGRGQVQKWFLLRAREGAEPRPDGTEFEAYEWVPPARVLERAVSFRRRVYERVLETFCHLKTEPR